MGAFGAALLAHDRCLEKSTLVDATTLSAFDYRSKSYRCGGCGNNCLVTAHYFPAGVFHTGNRCPRGAGLPMTNTSAPNMYAYKYHRVFDYEPLPLEAAKRGVIGIPRILNMYEDYPSGSRSLPGWAIGSSCRARRQRNCTNRHGLHTFRLTLLSGQAGAWTYP